MYLVSAELFLKLVTADLINNNTGDKEFLNTSILA